MIAARIGLMLGSVKRKLGMALAVILLIVGCQTCVYDRATWYGDRERGKLMADGRRFDPEALTAASWDYPLGSKLRVVYGSKSVVVVVTDRGGAKAAGQFGKVVDLSRAAFARLEKPSVGSIRVKITRVR